MPMYRKKPSEVEVHIFSGSSTSVAEIDNWIETGTFKASGLSTRDIRTMEVKTADGLVRAEAGDYILKRADGSFLVRTPKEFNADYEIINAKDRTPAIYTAQNLVKGDEFDYCGKMVTVVSVENYHDQTKVYLSDDTNIAVRPWTEFTVVAVKGE